MTEANHLVLRQVTADHSFRQTRLKGLINDLAVSCEVDVAASHKNAERKLFRSAAALSVEDFDRRIGPGVRTDASDKLHLPDALTSIAMVLFKDARTATGKTSGEPLMEVGNGSIQVSICPPAQFARAIEHLLNAHFENDVGVSAYPHSPRGDLA